MNIIDARNLKGVIPDKSPNSCVRLAIEGQSNKTQVIPNNADPIWNEVISFDIEEGAEDLLFSVLDGNQVIGKFTFSLLELSKNSDTRHSQEDGMEFDSEKTIDQMKQDFQRPFEKGQGTIRFSIQWIYSKVKLLNDILNALDIQIQQHEEEKAQIEQDLNLLKNPFDFGLNKISRP